MKYQESTQKHKKDLHVVEGETFEGSLVETLLLALVQTVDRLQPADVLLPQPGPAPNLTVTNPNQICDLRPTCLKVSAPAAAPESHLPRLPGRAPPGRYPGPPAVGR